MLANIWQTNQQTKRKQTAKNTNPTSAIAGICCLFVVFCCCYVWSSGILRNMLANVWQTSQSKQNPRDQQTNTAAGKFDSCLCSFLFDPAEMLRNMSLSWSCQSLAGVRFKIQDAGKVFPKETTKRGLLLECSDPHLPPRFVPRKT